MKEWNRKNLLAGVLENMMRQTGFSRAELSRRISLGEKSFSQRMRVNDDFKSSDLVMMAEALGFSITFTNNGCYRVTREWADNNIVNERKAKPAPYYCIEETGTMKDGTPVFTVSAYILKQNGSMLQNQMTTTETNDLSAVKADMIGWMTSN